MSRILILDYGSQYTQLIARRVREARVYSEIHPPTRSIEWIRRWLPTGIILSGGPNSVYDEGVPTADPALLDVAPVLGICYGMQVIAQLEGGGVTRAGRREYGRAELEVLSESGLFSGFNAEVSSRLRLPVNDLAHEAELAVVQLRKALDAFARLDTQKAVEVLKQDDQIDQEFDGLMRKLITYMMEDPRTISSSIDLVFVAKAIERVGDHAKNLAEVIIYIVKGTDVRHNTVAAVESMVK